jgi:LmbE family N-acetylglucosaminyl deacetylase
VFTLPLTGERNLLRSVLVVGCHADDIEIGCGGTILTLTRTVQGLQVTWLVLSARGERAAEARASAEAFLAEAGSRSIHIHAFRDGFLPHNGEAAKDVFESLKSEVDPQLILTHTRDDLHQDHRFAADLTRETFRDHLILEYEIPKVDGDLGPRNVYVELSEAVAAEKVDLLHRYYPTQASREWFDADTFMGLMRLRGMEAVARERYAEAFTCRRLVTRL